MCGGIEGPRKQNTSDEKSDSGLDRWYIDAQREAFNRQYNEPQRNRYEDLGDIAR